MSEADLLELVEKLRAALVTLLDDEDALTGPSVPLRGFNDPELGVLRLASWLYALQNESAKDAFTYLLDIVWNTPVVDLSSHMAIVRKLRTYFQHHLAESSRDEAIRQEVETWMASGAGFDEDDPAHWRSSLSKLAGDATQGLLSLVAGVEDATKLETASAVSSQWAIYKERAIPAHVVDSRIAILAEQIGLSDLNVKSFRDRYFSTWKKNLQLLNANADPTAYLDGLIERELLNLQQVMPMPVSGEDVMDAFGLAPGREVGSILRTVSKLHSESGGTKEELLRQAATILDLEIYLDPAE